MGAAALKFRLVAYKILLQHTNSYLLHTKWVLQHAKSVAVVVMLAFTSHKLLLHTVYCQLYEDKEITLGYWDNITKENFFNKGNP